MILYRNGLCHLGRALSVSRRPTEWVPLVPEAEERLGDLGPATGGSAAGVLFFSEKEIQEEAKRKPLSPLACPFLGLSF